MLAGVILALLLKRHVQVVELSGVILALSMEVLAGVILALQLKSHVQVIELAGVILALSMEVLVGVILALLLKATSEERRRLVGRSKA